MVAAAIGGYLAINAAAFVTGLEFGIQPALFTNYTGAPLYAPYPLSIAVPAMMFAHLTIAGAAPKPSSPAAEYVAYLQRSNPRLLEATARETARERAPIRPSAAGSGRAGCGRGWGCSWWFSPLGLLAAGIAWGEWGVEDFGDPAIRDQIAPASATSRRRRSVPQGLAHLSSFWTAPIPDYAPPFMRPESFGYILSAVVGAGLIVLVFSGLSWLMGRARSGESRA